MLSKAPAPGLKMLIIWCLLQRITYAKTKSDALAKAEGTYVEKDKAARQKHNAEQRGGTQSSPIVADTLTLQAVAALQTVSCKDLCFLLFESWVETRSLMSILLLKTCRVCGEI